MSPSSWSTFLRRSRRDTFRQRRRPDRSGDLVNLPQKVTSRHFTPRVLKGPLVLLVNLPQKVTSRHRDSRRTAPRRVRLVNLPQKVTSRHPVIQLRPKAPAAISGQPSSEGHVATPLRWWTLAMAARYWSTFLRRSRRDTPVGRVPEDRPPPLVNLPQKVTSRHNARTHDSRNLQAWSTFLRRSRRDTVYRLATHGCLPDLVNLPQKVTSRHLHRHSVPDALAVLVNLPQKVTSRHEIGTGSGRGGGTLVNLPQKVTSRHRHRRDHGRQRAGTGQPSSEGHVATRAASWTSRS